MPVAAYEYVPDSEIASVTVATSLLTGQSGSEEDLLADKVGYRLFFKPTAEYQLNSIITLTIAW